MKTYTFKTIKTKKNDAKSGNNFSEMFDNIILNNMLKANPYLADMFENETITTKTPKSKTIDIDITIEHPYTKNTEYDGIKKCIEYFYANHPFKKDYDFKLPDGTPVKLYSDEIQIGYDLIPLNGFTKKVYDALSEECKKNIVEITIELQKKNNNATILIA